MRKSPLKIAVLYSAFAVLSVLLNIGTQILVVWLYQGPFFIEGSIFAGTVAGLPLRYVLEKRYIFAFSSRDIAHDGRLFVIYSAMGAITTAIFWGTEYAFHLIYASDVIRYLGGCLGLSVGFYVKYQLDKKYVFVSDQMSTKS